MKSFVFFLAGSVVTFTATQISLSQEILNRLMNFGSVAGVERCIEIAASNLVSETTQRTACVDEFHRRIFAPDIASGRAGPREREGIVFWEGNLRNENIEYVTTWVAISVATYDGEGNRSEFEGDAHVWIEPRSSDDFSIQLEGLAPELINDLDFCPLNGDEKDLRNCMSWGVSDAKALEV